MKLFEKVKVAKEREIRFLDIPIIKYGQHNNLFDNYKEKYFDIFPKFGFREKLFNDILKKAGAKYDHIFIIRQASGEPYLLTSFYKALIEKYNAKSPLFVGIREYHELIFKMFQVDVPYLFYKTLPQLVMNSVTNDDYYYKGSHFHVYISRKFFDKFYADAKADDTNSMHYYENIMKFYGINVNDKIPHSAIISQEKRQSMLNKIKSINLNIENFLFLSTDALACESYSRDFWCELSKKLYDNGYDLFHNTLKKDTKLPYT